MDEFLHNETHYNVSNSTYHNYGMPVITAMVGIILLVIILTLVGNTMVVLTIVRHKGMRTRTNMFLVNLAVADILVAILNMPISLITIIRGEWIFGEIFCKINGFTMAVLLICSIQTLMYISIHKYISITRPFSQTMRPKRILMMIAATWIWSIACGMSPLLGWNTIIYKKGSSQCGPSLPTSWLQYSHSIFITSTNYIIPLCVMSFCYYHIFREINQHLIRIRETSNIDLSNSVSQQKRITITLVLVLACFLLCWTPFIVYSSAVSVLKDKSKMPLIINPVAYWCGYLNSACNPIIYALRSPSFRQGYREIMCEYVPVESRNVQNNKLMKFYNSGKALSAPCTPAIGKERNRENRIPMPFRNRVLLSQTSWSSLPLLSLQMINRETQMERSKIQLFDFVPNSSVRSGISNGKPYSNHKNVNIRPHISRMLNKDETQQKDNCYNREQEEQSSTETLMATLTPNDSPRCFKKVQFRSCYEPKRPSVVTMIRSASLDTLDSSIKLDSGVWTSKLSLRWKAGRKKRKIVSNCRHKGIEKEENFQCEKNESTL